MIESEFLEGETLEQFKNILRAYVLLSYGKRSLNFNYLNFGDMFKWRCRNCSRSFLYFKSKNRFYCSDACKWAFFYEYQFETVQNRCLRRDKYRCKKCGISVIQIKEETKYDLDKQKYIVIKEVLRTSWYDIDHIQEIATAKSQFEEAQLFFDIHNLQVLCKSCHKQKTALFLHERFSKPKNNSLILEKKNKSRKLLDYI